ncbi:MAG: NADH-quinone oxidoreductase subunit H [Nocardioides sp.]|nr:NADH-quinone oxidoreductase subunit H [Nocardioides sp.]
MLTLYILLIIILIIFINLFFATINYLLISFIYWGSLKFLFDILICLIPIIGVLISVAFFTVAERKILGLTQRRFAPNVAGAFGFLQALSDGLKLLTKESIFPSNSNKFIFYIAPIITFTTSLMGWAIIPVGGGESTITFAEISLSSLYLLMCSALGIYGILISGWASNSKYAFLGAMRSAAQMVSYELPIGIVLCSLVTITGSFDLHAIVDFQSKTSWFIFIFPLLFLIFFICIVAETNRHPFDLPEAEAELVSGYNVEYSAMNFALFSLGEYSSILIMSSFAIILFFGGWLPFPFQNSAEYLSPLFFSFKILFFMFLFVLLRAALPRYRYDQLMEIGWIYLLPFSLFFFSLINIFVHLFNSFPY